MSYKLFRSFFILIFIIGLLAIQAPQPARAAGPLYVTPAGDDNNDCLSPTTPCATINGAIGKATSEDTIYVATGTYTGTGSIVVIINKNLNIYGGWNAAFSNQDGFSTIDGQNARKGIDVYGNVIVYMERFIVKNGTQGILVENYSSNTLTLNQVSVNNNSSSYGGGIYSSGNVTLINSTVSNNTALNSGGGIYHSGGSLSMNNSTVSSNTSSAGGGIYSNGGTINITNSIVANNSVTISDSDCSGSITSDGNNIIGDTSGCTVTATTGDQFNIDPGLGTFLPVQGYHPLTSVSPAINGGNPATCSTTDQRDIARVGTCDIGSYEYTTPGAPSSIWAISGGNQRAEINSTFSLPLKVVILDSQGSPVNSVSVTFTAPGSGASGTFTSTGTNTTSVNTDAGGAATTSSFTANGQVGAYNVSASVSGVDTVDFSLQNVAWYVATTGNDSNSCSSPALPCLTINGAISKAAEGDRIKVAVGTYTGSGTEVVLIEKDITLSGGWNSSFTTQSCNSTIDGQGARRGIAVRARVTILIERFIVQNGYTDYGGGIDNSFGTLTLNNSIVSNNTATNYGGGIYAAGDGVLTLNNSTVSGNSGNGTGGGIYNGDMLTLNNSIVSNNTSNGGGGGIRNGGTLTFTNSTISNNNASDGGGIYNEYGKTITINDSTISGNSGGVGGGGIYNYGGTITVNNSTISGNSANSRGGGIENASAGVVNLNNSTVSENTATDTYYAGGGIYNSGSSMTLRNTILAGNTASANGPECNGDPISSSGYNLVGNNSGCEFSATTGDFVGTDSSPINPRLTPLQDNGGPTFTHALMEGSPAIDAGNPAGCTDQDGNQLTTDQRGIIRPQGVACDIGAFELEVSIPVKEVTIDIKPGSNSNPINRKSLGKIPVAILSTAEFDAPSMVDKTSLTFGKTGDETSLAVCNNGSEDVNDDGLLDQVCHFYTQKTGFQEGDFEGILKGLTVDGTSIKGSDLVRIVP